MALAQLVLLALLVSIVLTVFGLGLRATTEELVYLGRRPGLLARSLVATVVIMPVFAVALTSVLALRPAATIALVALALSPVPPLLPGRQTGAGGHRGYAVGLLAVLAALSVVVVPLEAQLLARFYGKDVSVPVSAFAAVILKTVFLPLGAGVLVRAVRPSLASRIERPVALVAKVLLPIGAALLLAGAARAIRAEIEGGTIVAMAAFVAVGLAVGHVLGGPSPEHSAVLAYATACRHPAVAFSIAAASFPEARVGATILLYLLVNVIVGLAYVAWLRARRARPPSAGPSAAGLARRASSRRTVG